MIFQKAGRIREIWSWRFKCAPHDGTAHAEPLGLEGRGEVLLISPAFAIGTCNAGSEFSTELECLECDAEILLMLG